MLSMGDQLAESKRTQLSQSLEERQEESVFSQRTLSLEYLGDFSCVGHSLGLAASVVCADGIPSISQSYDVLRQNPGAHVGIGASVEQIPLGNAIPLKNGYPPAVDLHVPDVVAAIGIAVDRLRVA
jgi:hypothetical protein